MLQFSSQAHFHPVECVRIFWAVQETSQNSVCIHIKAGKYEIYSGPCAIGLTLFLLSCCPETSWQLCEQFSSLSLNIKVGRCAKNNINWMKIELCVHGSSFTAAYFRDSCLFCYWIRHDVTVEWSITSGFRCSEKDLIQL